MSGTRTPATGFALVFTVVAVGIAVVVERLVLGGDLLLEAVLTALLIAGVFSAVAFALNRF